MLRRHPYDAIKAGRASDWVIGLIAAFLTLSALVVGSAYGDVKAKPLDPRLAAWISAAALLVAGFVATSRLSSCLSHVAARRSHSSGGSAARILSAVVGYLFVAFAFLDVLSVGIERLLVGAGLAGVVFGIAAQQSLGNAFAGLVLLMARPFDVGDHIRIRSGALGGIFDVRVVEMSLTYVTVRTDDGLLKIPNSGMLAAGVGQLPVVSSAPAPAPTTISPNPAGSAPAPGATAPTSAPTGTGLSGEPAP